MADDAQLAIPYSLTAKATVAPVGGDAFADRDVYGTVELLDGDRVIGYAPTRRGVATFDVSGLAVGALIGSAAGQVSF